MFADDWIVVVLFIGFYQPCGGFSRQARPAEKMGGRGRLLLPPPEGTPEGTAEGTAEGAETGRGETSSRATEEKTSRPAAPA